MRTSCRSKAGCFAMGSEDRWAYPEDGEGPVKEVEVSAFSIGAYAVSNAEFSRFVEETGYVTDAERFGWSFVFAGLLPDDFPPTEGVAQAPWWRKVEGADWRHPEGPALVDRRAPRPPGRPRLLARRGRVLRLGGRTTPHGGGVGVRRPRRAGREGVPLGRRARARR